ncbi:hypothetical protein FBU59_000881 [Linderina macrospora]|uniref:Uncharacterized protein n=1 Tax=Linderina macrospora TaxID=4868 RepID=A0ACC1JFE9_9FUNG|nr:hypothetical protein FBU59_000881 [Linderina macrospora]
MATSSSVTRTSHRVGTLDSLDQCTFHAFEVLPSLPQKDKAMAVLRKLAKDEGVRQIMQKHKYSVGILRELHPFEQTILGYNRNRGQVIALRLRTDDLEGFRDYLSVRQVLMHELAHMVWDEHDERFHELNRTHCKEVVELDWTRRGNTLAGNRRQVEVYDPEVEMQVDGGSLKPQGFVLGGKKAPEMPSMPSSAESDPAGARRDLLYRAYEKRNNKEL